MTASTHPPQPKKLARRGGRKLLGFYVAVFVVLGLFSGGVLAWPRVAAWRRERATAQHFIRNLERRVNVDFKDADSEEALNYFRGLMDVGMWGKYDGIPDIGKRKVTLQFEDVPIAVVLDSWCRQVGADWTVADTNCGKGDWPMFKLCLGSPEYIRTLEQASPVAARVVRSYRQGLRKGGHE